MGNGKSPKTKCTFVFLAPSSDCVVNGKINVKPTIKTDGKISSLCIIVTLANIVGPDTGSLFVVVVDVVDIVSVLKWICHAKRSLIGTPR